MALSTSLIIFLTLLTCSPLYAVELSFCGEGCPKNSQCIAGKCVCDVGYKQTIDPETELPCCAPMCQTDCMANADCSAPDTCDCRRGFAFNEERTECLPNTEDDLWSSTESTSSSSDSSDGTPHYADVDSEDDGDGNTPAGSGDDAFERYVSVKCAKDFVLHKGACRPIVSTTEGPTTTEPAKDGVFDKVLYNARCERYLWVGITVIVIAILLLAISILCTVKCK